MELEILAHAQCVKHRDVNIASAGIADQVKLG
jgi:hypothetical protein